MNGFPGFRPYIYGGTGKDTLTAWMDRTVRPPEREKFKTGTGRPRAPHGTLSAYRRHQRHGEQPCAECRQAKNADLRERRAAGFTGRPRKGTGRPLRPHGTPAGYRRHLRAFEKPCEACAEAARTDALYRIRQRRAAA